MNRAAFFAALRSGALFGSRLTQQQVEGTEAILDAASRHGMTNSHHVANVMAQVYHETGSRMVGVRETFATSDAQAIARLDAAFKKGQLTWVKTPYWRDGWFGRGMVQITHKANYERLGKRLGVDLVANPDLALRNDISADIVVVGMGEGLFTGKKLADYNFPAALDASPTKNPRRIVNGVDGTDVRIAGYHRAFLSALQAGGFGKTAEDQPVAISQPIILPEEAPMPTPRPEPGYEHTPKPSPVEQANKSVGAAKGAAQGSVVAGALITLMLAFGVIPEELNTAEVGAALGVVLTALFSIVQAAVSSYRAPKNAE